MLAAAPRSASMACAERLYSSRGVVAVVVGFQPAMELSDIAQGFANHFQVDADSLKVSMLAPREFLVLFSEVRSRNEALSVSGALMLGNVSFMLSPWTRFRRASAAKLLYRVRVCLDGVPKHAWDILSVAQLFDRSMLIEGIDDSCNSPEETACMKLWVWMEDVNMLAKALFGWAVAYLKADVDCLL